MGEVLLGIMAGVLIFTGGAALVASLVGMPLVLCRRFKATRELAVVSGESGSSEPV